jgi:ABC-type sulfate transport system permease component
LWRVTLALALRGVFTGAVLVSAPSISGFGAVVIIACFGDLVASGP